MRFSRLLTGALLLALFASSHLPAVAYHVDASNFTIDQTLILNLYNNTDQSHQLNGFPLDQAAHVLSVTLKNGPLAYTPCFNVYVNDPTSNSNPVVSGGKLTLKRQLEANETRVCNLNDFDVSGTFSGTVDPGFQNQMENDFKNVDPSKLEAAVTRLLRKNFQICVQPEDCSGNSIGTASCYNLTLFTQNPGADCMVAQLIYPHNNAVPDSNITFIWLAAQTNKKDCPAQHTLQLIEGERNGPVFESIDVPAGQNFYQWGPSNKALKPGVQYYWRVVGRDCAGKTFCGPGNQGWSVLKWFRIDSANACIYSLKDVDDFIRKNANKDQQDQLKKFIAARINKPNGFNDPFICRLLRGEATLQSIEVKTK